MAKLRVGILFGGRSGEHEVSLLSAASVLNAIDKTKYEVVPIGITKDGRWLTAEHAERLLRGEKPASLHPTPEKHLRAGDPDRTPGAAVLATGESVIVPPEPARHDAALAPFQTDASLRRASDRAINVDVIFPVLHGTFGEDGTIQGLLELADIAYVGAGVLGSSAGMDKDIMKSLFRAAALPIVKHVTVLRGQFEREQKKVEKLVESKLKYPVFVKPANLGSSVGISKAHDRKELGPAIAAFQAVDCTGLARVDFLMDPKSRKIFVNEINTMPGFTAISMYPKLWAATGVSYPDLIDRLIQLGIERHEDKKQNQYSR